MGRYDLTDEQLTKQQSEFFLKMGRASMAWSRLENLLCVIFSRITRTDPTLSRYIFYSARSFAGRVDMLRSAMSCPTIKLEPLDQQFVKKCIQVAGQYASVRNIIAHDSAVYFNFEGHEYSGQHVLVDGKHDRFLGGENALTIEQLEKYLSNISHLVMLVQIFIQREKEKANELGEQYLKLLNKIPPNPRDNVIEDSVAKSIISFYEHNTGIPFS